ncbi:DNA primase DnaG [Halocatena pleomorpha]|uniref:DNA primase DnaG n=1 Tax=Halocatena pleomorpha TaxID=1785090 RepID=A0A3P3R5K2_9EURY|nr:DNA primase DnaG [Halocatena pleomorpha]RRJ28169.1 DNA primase [Halocatena pleomorpha]
MYDTAKYLIHANITAEGVVERSDVVGAVFGQTEGLLGDELDLRDLQDSSKIGRIDVEIDSEQGQSFGTVTIASGLDQVETAILAASLETIERVGPCRSRVEIDRIEDVRAAKRRQIVDRAKTLLGEAFDGGILTSEELVEEVRRSIRVEDITEYEGLPAGPRVEDSDAIIVVEGRSDVLTLLQYGVKNAIGVEGTNIPAPITELAAERTVTVFFDGDRGGDLILKELGQVTTVDYVAVTPPGQNVEDLSRSAVMKALREKVPYETVTDANTPRDAMAATDGSARPAPPAATPPVSESGDGDAHDTDADAETGESSVVTETGVTDERTPSEEHAPAPPTEPETLRGHVRAVIVENTGSVRLLDEQFDTLDTGDANEAFNRIKTCESVPAAVVLDGELSQRVLDIAAQRGVAQIVAHETAAFVKQPTSVRIRTADQLVQAES